MKKKKLLLPVLAFVSIFTNIQTTQAMTIDEDSMMHHVLIRQIIKRGWVVR